jgi:hypothetical protein
MKRLIIILMPLLLCTGCVSGLVGQNVAFEYFNLSTNRIKVVDVVGLPAEATPGVLIPSQTEDGLSVKASVFYETVHIKSQIKIVWQEADTSHEFVLKRDDFGIPATLRSGKIRFTYLGGEKWRVKRLEDSAKNGNKHSV